MSSSNGSSNGRVRYRREDYTGERGSTSGMSHSQSASQSQSQSRSMSHTKYFQRDRERDSSMHSGMYSPRSSTFSSALGSPTSRNLIPINTTYTADVTDNREVVIMSPNSRSRFDETPRPASPPPLRTLDDIRDQVSQEVAIHTLSKLKLYDGVKIGVRLVMTSGKDDEYLRLIGEHLRYLLKSSPFLFALATSPFTGGTSMNTLLLCSSSEILMQRCILLSSSKFIGRVIGAWRVEENVWMYTIRDLGAELHDETALWDVLEKSSRAPIDHPMLPPPGSRGILDMIGEARAKLQRISAEQALDELRESQVGAPTFLVDIRSSEQRKREGGIHGSLIIERNMLEMSLDPRVKTRLAVADRYDLRVIILDQEGNMSSLAAYSLQQIGLLNATDIIGGYEAWKNAGLPIDLDTLTTFNTQNTTQTQHAQDTFLTDGGETRSQFLPDESVGRHE